MPVVINKDECVGCGCCEGVCPVGFLSMGEDGKMSFAEGVECVECGTCVDTCPVGAISL